MSAFQSAASFGRQRGFGLVEVMVGLVIGLIAVLVIYQVYNVAEGFKRNTTAAGEAQMAGLFSAFVLGMETANGGAAMALSAPDLGSCADTGNIATSFRPIPVLITDGGAPGTPDSFVVTYSMATTLVSPAMFNFDANADDPYEVQSPGGFHVGDLIVAVAKPGSVGSDCPSSVITAVSAPALRVPPPLINDAPTEVADVTITHTGTGSGALLKGDGRPGLSTLFNMGPCAKVQKVRYDVSNNVLRATPLLDTSGATCGQLANPAVPNPLASNIVNMKIEYGIDSVADPIGVLDTWVQATVDATGDWTPAGLLPAPITQINKIKAIRIGIIVQSEQFDKDLATFTGGDYTNGTYNWVLFDCPTHNAACPGRLTGSIPPSVSPAGNWRFRKYETIIPLRNEIWNKQS